MEISGQKGRSKASILFLLSVRVSDPIYLILNLSEGGFLCFFYSCRIMLESARGGCVREVI